MDKLRLTVVAVVSIWGAGFVQPATSANITIYSDRAVFDAAVGVTTVEDFLSSAHAPITSGVLNEFTDEAGILPGDIQPGVTYSTPVGTGFFFNIDAGGGFTGGFLDSVIQSEGDRRALTVDFVSPVAAFGFDTNDLMGQDLEVVIHFVSGEPFEGTFAVAQSRVLEFFGFQSNLVDIESVVIQGSSTGINQMNYALDNFSFGGMAVPVPPAVFLFGSGLLGLAAISRRNRAG